MKIRGLDLRISWCVMNIAILVPVLFPLFTGRNMSVFIPGFLSYCYAFLAVSLYLFDEYLKIVRPKEINFSSTKKWVTILVIIVLIFIYVSFNPETNSIEALILYIGVPIIFLLVFWLSYQLNIPLMVRQEQEEEKNDELWKEKFKENEKTRVNTRRGAKVVVSEELDEDKTT